MRSSFVWIFVCIVVFQDTKCDDGQFQNQYSYPPRNNIRQSEGLQGGFPNQGQQSGNVGQLPNGQPMNGGQPMGSPAPGGQPMTGNPPMGGGQQMPGNLPMTGGQAQVGDPSMGNGQLPNGQFNTPTNPPFQQQNPQFNGPNSQPPFQNPYQPPYQNPQIPPPYGLYLTPEGQQAYSSMLQQLGNMLNNPTSRQELETLVNSMNMLLSYPNSLQIIQEFINRWLNALNQLSNGGNTNVIVQQLQQPSIFDVLKRKGLAAVNLINDVANAKAKAISTVFDGTPLAPFARAGTNFGTSAVQTFTGMATPFLNTPSGSTITTVNTPTGTTYG